MPPIFISLTFTDFATVLYPSVHPKKNQKQTKKTKEHCNKWRREGWEGRTLYISFPSISKQVQLEWFIEDLWNQAQLKDYQKSPRKTITMSAMLTLKFKYWYFLYGKEYGYSGRLLTVGSRVMQSRVLDCIHHWRKNLLLKLLYPSHANSTLESTVSMTRFRERGGWMLCKDNSQDSLLILVSDFTVFKFFTLLVSK